MCQAAKAIGNTELENKFAQGTVHANLNAYCNGPNLELTKLKVFFIITLCYCRTP